MGSLQGGKNFEEWLLPQDLFNIKNSIFTLFLHNFREKLHPRCSTWISFVKMLYLTYFARIQSVNYFCKRFQLRCLTRTPPVNYFCKCLHLRCVTRVLSIICFHKKLHPRCLILDILRNPAWQ